MVPRLHRLRTICFLLLLLLVCTAAPVAAQSTTFTYQGKLTDSGNLANGSYDLQFKLFDALSGGSQQGTTQTATNVTVTSGIFTVQLDFGVCAGCFNGAARFLEIAVKPTSGGSFTTLAPRQPVTSTPYAINAAQLGGLAASGFLQNSTSQQASSNFNISGNGTAGGTLTGSIVNAVQQVNINGLRAFTVNGAFNDFIGTVFTASNTFAGDGAGVNTTPSGTLSNSSGKFNSFYGAGAGQANTTGASNAFFGTQAGQQNTTGARNSFFGLASGNANTTGNFNSFFGALAGQQNTTGGSNAFFGHNAGSRNTTGLGNTFIGTSANFNVFNPTGDQNTLLGFVSTVTSGVSNGTAIGANASVTQSNSLILGSINGVNGATADTNVGIGTTAPAFRLDVVGDINSSTQYNLNGSRVLSTAGAQNLFAGISAGTNITTGGNDAFFGTQTGLRNTTGTGNAFFGFATGSLNTTGNFNTFIGASADFDVFNPTGNNNTLLGFAPRVTSGVSNGTAIGANASVTQSNSLILGSINGVNSATADTNVGIGTTAPQGRLNVNGTSWFQGDSTPLAAAAGKGLAVGFSPPNGNGYIFAFDYATFQPQTLALNSPGGKVGIGTLSPDQTLTVNGGASKPGGGSWATFSDARLKNITGRFTPGLRAVMQLQPIRYEYKRDNALGIPSEGEHIGFNAQAVQKIIPEAVSRNDRGYLLVNNDPILWTMLNAVKEQQAQIEKQAREIDRLQQREQRHSKPQPSTIQLRQQIKQQRDEISRLKQLVCLDHPGAALCRKTH